MMSEKIRLGIEISASSIKLLGIDSSGPEPIVKYAAVAERVRYSEEEGLSEDEITFARLKELVNRYELGGKECELLISGTEVVVRYIALPDISENELYYSIRHNAKSFSPYPLEEVYLSHHITEKIATDKGQQLMCMVALTKKQPVDDLLFCVKKANLIPRRVSISPLCMMALLKLNKEYMQGTVVMVESGHENTSISIMDDGILRFSREVPLAGSAIDELIAKELSEDKKNFFDQIENAIQFKKSLGILKSEEIEKKGGREKVAAEMIVEGASRLVQRIRLSIGYHKTQAKIQKVDRVLFIGGLAKLKGLEGYMSQQLEIPAKVFPLENLMIPDKTVDENIPNIVAINGQSLAILLGLTTDDTKFDLLPTIAEDDDFFKNFQRKLEDIPFISKVFEKSLYFSVSVWLLVLAMIGLHWGNNYYKSVKIDKRVKEINETKKVAESKRNQFAVLIKEYEAIKKEKLIYKWFNATSYEPHIYLEQMSKLFSPLVFVNELEMDIKPVPAIKDGAKLADLNFRITAEAPSLDIVNQSVNSLKGDSLFTGVQLESVNYLEGTQRDQESKMRFIIRGGLIYQEKEQKYGKNGQSDKIIDDYDWEVDPNDLEEGA